MSITPELLMPQLMKQIEALSPIGREPHDGLWRRSFTPAEIECYELVSGWMRAAGLTPRRDAGGNLIGRLEGRDPGLPVIAAGSHLDSVRNGGNYDGPLGTLAALNAVEQLYRQYGAPLHPVEVVAFTGEEGSRFPGGFIGSLAMAGTLSDRELAKIDDKGVTMAEAMRSVGLDPDRRHEAARSDWGAFLELHIEQGRVLESMDVPIGLAYAIVGMLQVRVSVTGRADHAGTTPMDLRHDAMRAAAEMIVESSAMIDQAGPPAVITAGKIELKPGATNIVAAEVNFTFDFRDADAEQRQRLAMSMHKRCEEIAAQRKVTLGWEIFHNIEPTPCDKRIIGVLGEAATELGLAYHHMVSGAGHDAMITARFCPTALMFVPSRDGRSHTPEEYTTPEHCAQGAAVLAGALKRLAW